ncbi:hypothetical protein AB6A40_011293 [Gnathostoma spinigerum]|uniref:Uncharacterized protein n=1 Tax=Gnathostoma spinigerum TaxID=75299 RepID=A0ABD6EX89_9BILA
MCLKSPEYIKGTSKRLERRPKRRKELPSITKFITVISNAVMMMSIAFYNYYQDCVNVYIMAGFIVEMLLAYGCGLVLFAGCWTDRPKLLIPNLAFLCGDILHRALAILLVTIDPFRLKHINDYHLFAEQPNKTVYSNLTGTL